ADEAPRRRLGNDITLLDVDLGAELLEAIEEKIHRPRADGAAAGEGDARLVRTGEQRTDDPEAGAHGRDELVGRGGVDDLGSLEGHALAVEPVGTRAAAMYGNIDAVVLEDALELLDV